MSTTRGRSLTFSIQQDSTTTKYNIDQFRGTHLQTRQVRRWANRWVGVEGWGGVGSCPGASGSTFFVGNRPVNVCKKLALSVCEDMRLPQRSMAYGWDEWNGDNKVSGGATRGWGCTLYPSTQNVCLQDDTQMHTKHFCKHWHIHFHRWRHMWTQDKSVYCCKNNLKQLVGGIQNGVKIM